MPFRFSIFALFVAALVCATGARAQEYGSVVVFGDSLSDAGNVAQAQGLPSGDRLHDQPGSGLGGDRGANLRRAGDALACRRVQLRLRRRLRGPGRFLQLSDPRDRRPDRAAFFPAACGRGRSGGALCRLGRRQRYRYHPEPERRPPAGRSPHCRAAGGARIGRSDPAAPGGRRSSYRGLQPARSGRHALRGRGPPRQIRNSPTRSPGLRRSTTGIWKTGCARSVPVSFPSTSSPCSKRRSRTRRRTASRTPGERPVPRSART